MQWSLYYICDRRTKNGCCSQQRAAVPENFLAGRKDCAHLTVLKPVPGSGSRAKCAQFRGSSDAKHVSSWFQPWATLWPTCHMLVPTSLLQSVECSTECKNSIFHCTIGFNKYKSSLASGASPQTPPGGLFLPCSSLVLVPEEVVEPASGRYHLAINRQPRYSI